MSKRNKKIPFKNPKKIAQEAFDWCVEKFGSPLKNGEIPTFEISFDRDSDCYGYYSSDTKPNAIAR